MLYEPTIFLTISFECFQIVKDRPEGGISSHKAPFAHAHSPMKELGDIVKEIKPTCLIGAAAIGGVFTEEILKDMASFNEKVGLKGHSVKSHTKTLRSSVRNFFRGFIARSKTCGTAKSKFCLLKIYSQIGLFAY